MWKVFYDFFMGVKNGPEKFKYEGNCYFRKGQYEKAINSYNKSIKEIEKKESILKLDRYKKIRPRIAKQILNLNVHFVVF